LATLTTRYSHFGNTDHTVFSLWQHWPHGILTLATLTTRYSQFWRHWPHGILNFGNTDQTVFSLTMREVKKMCLLLTVWPANVFFLLFDSSVQTVAYRRFNASRLLEYTFVLCGNLTFHSQWRISIVRINLCKILTMVCHISNGLLPSSFG